MPFKQLTREETAEAVAVIDAALAVADLAVEQLGVAGRALRTVRDTLAATQEGDTNDGTSDET